jgi:ADP-ribose pyrophosphatase YjhB (NUDIX family)
MQVGEMIAQTAIREVKEETGREVVVDRLVGIYSNPRTSSSTPTKRSASSFRSASPAGLPAADWQLRVPPRWILRAGEDRGDAGPRIDPAPHLPLPRIAPPSP